MGNVGRPAKAAVRVALAALAYFASARLGYAFALGGRTVTLWPPAGIMLGLLAAAPVREWPTLVGGALLGSIAADLLSDHSLPTAVAAAFANALAPVAGALVMKRFLPAPIGFSTLRALGVLAILVVGASNALTALAGAATIHAAFGTPFARAWFVWWIGDGLGMLIVAPVVLTWVEALRRREPLRRAHRLEAYLLAAVLIVAARVTLGPGPMWALYVGPYLIFPVLLWVALRFGPVGAATATFITAGVAIWYASLGQGPFVMATSREAGALMEAYAFLVVASISSHVAAAALSERHGAIAELRESRERYRNVVEAATDAIITVDEHNRIRFANPAAERTFGYAASELHGRDLKTVVPAPGAGRHRDGREIPLEVSFGTASDGSRQEITGILRDISEKRAAERAMQELEEQYRHSQKMEAIGQLAGGIAHDFNNLLTIVQVNCELMRDELPEASPLRPELEQVYTASKRAAALTRQLLAFSRRQVLAPRVVSLQDIVVGLEPMLRRLIGEHVTIRIEMCTPVGPVMADPGQIEQVILNLAINARDAMPQGGLLSIQLAEMLLDDAAAYAADVPPGRYVRLSVVDTGTGMDPETVARVFEPFFTTKPLGRGTGLGLSTVHGIVKQSGGGVTVHSQPQQGSTFSVFLPRVDAPVESLVRAPEADEPRARRDTVLVVEDEEDVGRLARRILEAHGYRVLLAASPDEALGVASTEPDIRVLLSDVVLPGMSGPALAKKLLRTHPAVRVLYMSGYTDERLSEHGVRRPDTELIEKPFSASALVARVDEVAHRA